MRTLIDVLVPLLSYATFFTCFATIFAIAVLGLNLQWGFTGLFNVGVAGFMAVGAYTSAILTAPAYAQSIGGFGLPIIVGWLGAMAASGFVALVVGVAALRLHHDYLAITTFGIAVTLQLVALNARWLTGGPFGLQFIPRPLESVLGTGFAWNLGFLLLSGSILWAAYGAFERLAASPWGRVLRAIREDETAAEALGKHAFSFRLQAFVIGCMVMGLSGALYAHFVGFIAPEDFLPVLTFQIWTMLIIGGAGNNRGAILGAFAVWLLWSLSGTLLRQVIPQAEQARGAALQIALIGIMLAVMLIWRPRGLFGESVGRRPETGEKNGSAKSGSTI